jgi:NADPH:quinone reductase-like Zn-dependent oxidoreductase
MKAVTFSEYGGPEVLEVTEVDEPHPGPGQVRIRVRGAEVNPIDCKLRLGAMAQFAPVEFPVVVGREAAGVVDGVGEGVSGTEPRRRGVRLDRRRRGRRVRGPELLGDQAG